MRLVPLLLLLLVFVPRAGEAQTFVQTETDAATQPWGTDAIAPITADSALTVGNGVCVGFGLNDNRTVVSVVDNGSGGSNTYLAVASAASPGNAVRGYIYCAIVERAATVITTTISSATFALGRLFLVEFSGINSVDFTGGSNVGSTASATSHTSGTMIAEVKTGSVMWGFTVGSTGTYTLDGTFTLNAAPDATQHVSGYRSITGDTAMTNTTAGSEASVTLAMEVLPPAIPTTTLNIRLRGDQE